MQEEILQILRHQKGNEKREEKHKAVAVPHHVIAEPTHVAAVNIGPAVTEEHQHRGKLHQKKDGLSSAGQRVREKGHHGEDAAGARQVQHEMKLVQS